VVSAYIGKVVLLQKIFWPHSVVVMDRMMPQHLV
jgi:hypothetical protein